METTAPGTLVLTVPAADPYRASVGSTRLEPTRAFGWAQGFRLPASVSGEVEVWQAGHERPEPRLPRGRARNRIGAVTDWDHRHCW